MNLNFGHSPNSSSRRPDAGTSFLPEDYLSRKRERRHNFVSLTLFCIVMFVVLAAFFVTNRKWSNVKGLQQDINSQYTAEGRKIDQLKVLEGQKKEMLEKAEITAALLERVPRSILLAEIVNRMPSELTLTDFKLTGKRMKDSPSTDFKEKAKPKPRSLVVTGAKPATGAPPPEEIKPKLVPPRFDFTIELIGLAAADANVADYQAALKECPLLESVDLVYTGTVKIEDDEKRKFRIEAKIRQTADARNIKPLMVPRNDLASRLDAGDDPAPYWQRKHGLVPGRAPSSPQPATLPPGQGRPAAAAPPQTPTTRVASPAGPAQEVRP